MHKTIAFLLVLVTSYTGWAQQEKMLTGTWIKTKVETLDGSRSEIVETRAKAFLRYTFLSDGTVYVGTYPDSYGEEDRYFLETNGVIVLHYISMKIESLTENEMVLIELDNYAVAANATKIYFVREEEYLRRQHISRDEYIVRDRDTIYKSSYKTYVTYNDRKTDFWSYLRTRLNDVKPPKKAEFAIAAFVVNPDGTVGDIAIWHHVSQQYDDSIKQLVSQTDKNWTTHPVDGKKVKVRKSFYIPLNITKKVKITETLTLTTIDDTKKFPQDYFAQYVRAMYLIDDGLWSDAISVLLNCVGLTTDPLNIYYQLSVCYGQMNNPELQQFYRDQLKKTRLAYLVAAQ